MSGIGPTETPHVGSSLVRVVRYWLRVSNLSQINDLAQMQVNDLLSVWASFVTLCLITDIHTYYNTYIFGEILGSCEFR